MSSSPTGAVKSVEVMLNRSLSRLNYLNGMNRKALYNEFKEWLDFDENSLSNEGVLYCNYLG